MSLKYATVSEPLHISVKFLKDGDVYVNTPMSVFRNMVYQMKI